MTTTPIMTSAKVKLVRDLAQLMEQTSIFTLARRTRLYAANAD